MLLNVFLSNVWNIMWLQAIVTILGGQTDVYCTRVLFLIRIQFGISAV